MLMYRILINSMFYLRVPLISQRNIFCINKLTVILKILCHCDLKHIMMLQIKTITSVWNVWANIITSPIRLSVIQMIMSVLTFKTDAILYVLYVYSADTHS